MARKRKPEDIIGKLREAEIVIAMADLWFRYLGTGTRLASTIWPPTAKYPASRSCCLKACISA